MQCRGIIFAEMASALFALLLLWPHLALAGSELSLIAAKSGDLQKPDSLEAKGISVLEPKGPKKTQSSSFVHAPTPPPSPLKDPEFVHGIELGAPASRAALSPPSSETVPSTPTPLVASLQPQASEDKKRAVVESAGEIEYSAEDAKSPFAGIVSRNQFCKFYAIKEEIGKGSFGQVFEASLRRFRISKNKFPGEVAVKIIKLSKVCTFELIDREIKVLRLLTKRHVAAVVKYYHSWKEDGSTYYIVMELIRGVNLQLEIQRIHSHIGYMPAEFIRLLFAKLSVALTAIHKCNVSYRDLKPENILIDQKGQPRFIDFGLAVIRTGTATVTDACGTLHFAAPEILKGRPYTDDPDIWSLGVTMFVAMTRRYPTIGEADKAIVSGIVELDTQKIAERIEGQIENINSRIPKKDRMGVRQIFNAIELTLEVDPEKRKANFSNLLDTKTFEGLALEKLDTLNFYEVGGVNPPRIVKKAFSLFGFSFGFSSQR